MGLSHEHGAGAQSGAAISGGGSSVAQLRCGAQTRVSRDYAILPDTNLLRKIMTLGLVVVTKPSRYASIF